MQLSAAHSIKSDNKGSGNSSQRGGRYEKHAISRYDDKRQKMQFQRQTESPDFGEPEGAF